MPRRIIPTVGLVLAVVLALAGCAEDEPSQPAADGGAPDAQVAAPPLTPDQDTAREPDAPLDAGPPLSSVGDCCEAQATAGCEEPTIEACVCALDRLCCAGAWDDRCVELVESQGCGQCGPEPSTVCVVTEAGDEARGSLSGTRGAVDGEVTDAVELSCGSIAEPEVVFGFTAPETGSYDFSTVSTDVIDTVLA